MNLQAEPLNLKEATVTCIPRLRGVGGGGRRSRREAGAATQVSMLDRVRDVVLRLAMLSATSTAATTAATTKGASPPVNLRRAAARVSPAASYTDSYRSEAVDDCIEFLKRSAAGGGAPATAVEASTAAVTSPLQHGPAVACDIVRDSGCDVGPAFATVSVVGGTGGDAAAARAPTRPLIRQWRRREARDPVMRGRPDGAGLPPHGVMASTSGSRY
ncbi:hypothetical protein HU200_067793 [Digitaria exilis]|uniref:Uncharacterized protein n=1 Tax=Digitaria exilis TaxID=1010633 RepID=A0A835DSL2_9POAL|nr:hypothetical protein HU200_067793 [Digitaria exilis]